MTQTPDRSTAALCARFRFSVVGPLLSSPPARGELKAAIRALAAKTWTHPVSRPPREAVRQPQALELPTALRHRSRQDAALQPLSERQARGILGDTRRSPDGDARWLRGADAGLSQHGDPGLGRDRVQPRGETLLAPLYPLDRSANADGRRAMVEPLTSDGAPACGSADAGQRRDQELPPLLKSILAEYSATGTLPAYLPKPPHSQKGQES